MSPLPDHDNLSPNPSMGAPTQPSACTNEQCIRTTAIDLASSPTVLTCTTRSLGDDPTIARYAEILQHLHEMTRSLGISVLISVFLATLVAAFLSLAYDVVHMKGDLEFEIAMFFCILSASCHISDVVVSGRAWILAYQHSRLRSIDRGTVEDCQKQLDAFNRCQRVSQWVQGLGQALFGIAALYTLWVMFKNRILISTLYAFVSLLHVGTYFSGFWRISWVEDITVPIGRSLLRLIDRRNAGERV